MHGILGNLQVSDIERTNAVLEMEKTCLNAYHAVLKEHRMLIQQISCSESEYNKICDILGEQELKKSKIKVSYKFHRIRTLFFFCHLWFHSLFFSLPLH